MSTTEEEKTSPGAESVATVDPTTAVAPVVEGGKKKDTAPTTPGVIPKSNQHESDELTKRLQKLALERQRESKGERLKVIQNDSAQQHLSSAKTFQELNLPAHLLDAIFAMGFDRPSAIQEEALPRILADPPRNLIGQAQSGSGKVRTFLLLLLLLLIGIHPCRPNFLYLTKLVSSQSFRLLRLHSECYIALKSIVPPRRRRFA